MDLESILRAALRELLSKHGFRLPIQAASLAANRTGLLTFVDEPPPGSPPGSIELCHVTGEVGDEGFAAPLYILFTDATGRARVAFSRDGGPPAILVPSDLGS